MRILVATDGSKAAAAAVRFGARAAAASRGELVVLHVGSISPRLFRQRAGLDRRLASALDEAERRSSAKALEGARREALRRGARVRCEYLEAKRLEPYAETIARTAQRERADLVVVGSRGGSPWTRWALGSVANRLVHIASRPVAVVPSRPRGSAQRSWQILVATDGSRAARAAVRFAARLALAIPRARLKILTVSTLAADLALTDAVLVRALGFLAELERADRRAGRRILDTARKEAQALGKRVRTRSYVPRGRVFAADAIVSEARRERADLIVVGHAGRTALGDVVLGSVAQRVIGLAKRPVAVVPAGSRRSRRRP